MLTKRKYLLAVILVLALCVTVLGASAPPQIVYPKFKAVDPLTGAPLVGGKLYTYKPGTDTPKSVFTNVSLTNAATNPVVLDANGEALIYPSGATDLVLKRSNGTLIWGPITVSIPSVYVVDVRDFGADPTGVSDSTTAVQNAVNSITTGVITYPAGTFKQDLASITLKEGVSIQGSGTGSTFITNSSSNWTFDYTTPNGVVERNAPKFTGFTLTANYGIRLNNPSNGFTGTSASQNFMMRPYIADVNFISYTGATGTAIQWSKAFDGTIERSRVYNYDKGIVFHGCDINTIRDSRIYGCATYQIGLNPDPGTYTYNTFGSQTLIDHNDLLALNDGGTAYIVTKDWHPIIKNNYFEQSVGSIESVVKVLGGYSFRFSGNRLEVPAILTSGGVTIEETTVGVIDFSTISLTPDSTNLPALIDINSNYTQGIPTAAVAWPAAGVPYWYGVITPRTIVHYGNIPAIANSMPFNSKPEAMYSGKTAYQMSPNLPTLDAVGYGATVKVKDGGFAIPPNATPANSLLQRSTGVGGTFDFYLEAKGGVANQEVVVGIYDGAAFVKSYIQPLTTSYAWYTLDTAGIAVSDLIVQIINVDVGHGTNGTVRKLQADYH